MKVMLALATAFTTPLAAETLTCTVAPPCPATGLCSNDPVIIQFTLNRDEFAPAISADEPPRRKVTTVRMGAAQFPAEAIIMGENRGFWAEGGGGSNVLFIVAGDGTAHYIEDRTGVRMEGSCEG